MSYMHKSKIPKSLQSHKPLTILACILVILVVSITIPLFASDGAEKYSGKEKEAAVYIIDSYKNIYSGDPLPKMYLKLHVESVEKMSDEKG